MNNNIQLWEVSLWPNNQPPSLLGEYYAVSAKAAIEMAGIEWDIKTDDDAFCAEPAGPDSPIKRWNKH